MEGEDGVTDPPTEEQKAAMAKADKEYGAVSEKYAVRADRINDGKSTSTTSGNQTGGNSGYSGDAGQSAQNGGNGPGDLNIFFDGKNLSLIKDGESVYSLPAVSGRQQSEGSFEYAA